MLRRISFITVFAVLFISLVAVPINTKAYVGPTELFTTASLTPLGVCSFNPSYDGIYIFQRFYKSFYSPDTLNSPVMLDNSYFYSGTFNGQNISELDSKYLYNLDVSGFSQTVSYTDEGNYFIYSMITCLPVKAGDNFSILLSSNTTNVRQYSYNTLVSYIPGGSGLKMVHVESDTSHPENPLSYTVSSKNQHIALVFNPDNFFSDYTHSFNHSNVFCCSSYPNLLSVGGISSYADIFTTSYNYTGDISVSLKDSVDNYSFSVYEIFTDGTATPGYNNTVEPPTSDSSGGDSGDSETSRGILDTVKNMFSKLKEIADNIYNLPQKISEIIGNFNTNIVNSIKGFFQDIKDYLVYLFVPSDNNFEKCKEVIDDKFKFVHQAFDYYKNFFNFTFLDEPPETNVTIYGETVSFMNWDLYNKYKPVIDNIIVFCAWFFYIRRLVKRIPGIIGGFHA